MDVIVTLPLDCGHSPTPENIAPGWAYGPDNETMCYDCATDRDLELIANSRPGAKVVYYLGTSGRTITNWPGHTLMPRVLEGAPWLGNGREHPDGRYHIQAYDNLGRMWRGVAAPGMWATLRLTKEVIRR
jgi:hypothetical protein